MSERGMQELSTPESEAAAAERRLQDLARQLEIVQRDLEYFSRSITHDLRTPLGQIDGFAYLLATEYSSRLDGKAEAYVQRIRGASRQMLGLIDELWSLGRIGRAELHPCELDLSDMARALAVDGTPSEERRAVSLVIQPNLVAFADADLTRIALDNLLRNALRFTSANETARIELGIQQSERGPIYFVKDDGAGFDLDGSIFARLQRMNSVPEFEGAGLRFAKAERAIERQGGRIWAESASGTGAIFYFTLMCGETSSENAY